MKISLLRMKLILLVISLSLLSIGWINKDDTIAIAGAVFFILSMLIDTFNVYRMAREYRSGNDVAEIKRNESGMNKLENIIGGFIVIVGLGAFTFGNIAKDSEVYVIPGCIIWVGAFFFYVLLGIIAQLIAGIRLRMGYGGWYIPRNPRRYRSNYSKKRRS